MSGGCVRCRPRRTSEVSGAWRCCHAPLSRQVVATAPVWEAFPEANRVLASRSPQALVSFQIVQDRLVKMLAEVCSMQLYCLRLGPDQWFVDIDADRVRLRTAVHGSGRPVLLITGLCSSATAPVSYIP